MTSPEALDLFRAAVLWAIGEGGSATVVRAACEALAAGLDGEALRELAGVSLRADELGEDVEESIQAALMEMGTPLPRRGTPEVETEAVLVMVREALQGRWVPRELAAWAHRAIGHLGTPMAQPLVELDDRYDTAKYIGEPIEVIDDAVMAYCRSVDLQAR